MSVLITGASGAICQKLAQKLKESNLEVKFFTANLNKTSKPTNFYYWNPVENYMDEEALEGVDTIVHLGGAGIAKARWSKERKQIIRDSRVLSSELLFNRMKTLNKTIKRYISASAIGIYPDGNQVHTEESSPGNDFVAKLCMEWEDSAKKFENEGVKTTIFRTGIVLDGNSGFYKEIAHLSKFYMAAVPGSGNQSVSWISMADMVNMYYQAITDDGISGTYNAVAPQPARLGSLIHAISKNERRKVLLPNIPPFVLKLIYGEMAQVLLSDKQVSPLNGWPKKDNLYTPTWNKPLKIAKHNERKN